MLIAMYTKSKWFNLYLTDIKDYFFVFVVDLPPLSLGEHLTLDVSQPRGR